MIALLVALTAAYAALALVSAVSAAGTPARDKPSGVELPRAAVIVAARNEEEVLAGCLDALLAQQYPQDRLRIVVSDDDSDDGTAAVAHTYAPRVKYVRAVETGDLRGKAAAIHTAVHRTDEELILLTDADCRPPDRWAEHMAAQFQERRIGVVSGVTSVAAPRSQRDGSLLARVQALDWTLLLTVAAGLSGAGRPITAMGNNMAFRREAYVDVGGYPALPPSVTEDYALFRAIHQSGWRSLLLLDERLENVTLPLPSLRETFAQRKRWARGGLRTDVWVYLVYLLIWMTHAAVLVGCFAAPGFGLAALGVKLSADAFVLRTGTSRLRRRDLWEAFPAFEAYFFAYLLALPASLLFAPRISWRGRRY